MVKNIRRGLLIAVSLGLCASSVNSGSFKSKAAEVLYSDANVSITAAVDKYVAENEDAFEEEYEAYLAAIEEQPVVTEETKAAPEATVEVKEVEKADAAEAQMEITFVENKDKDDKKETDEAEDTEEAKEEAEEEVTEEETEEASSDDDDDLVDAPQFDFSGKAVVSAGETVNIRSSESLSASRVGTIADGGIVDVVEYGDEWTHITSGGIDGYVKTFALSFGDDARAYAEANLRKVAVINVGGLRMRAGAGTEYDELAILEYGESYTVTGSAEGWTQIALDDMTGYLFNEYIIISYDMPTANAVYDEDTEDEDDYTSDDYDTDDTDDTEETSDYDYAGEDSEPDYSVESDGGLGTELVNYAPQFVGNPYVWGGTSLTEGCDCSGFTMRVYEHFGITIPRAGGQQTCGRVVSLAEIQPGDLLFYDHGTGEIQHVALYMGGGQIVHASNSTTGIIVSSAYYSAPCRAVRVIN